MATIEGHSALCVCPACMPAPDWHKRRLAAATALAFPGGQHVAEYPRRELLIESARSWRRLADEHNRAADEAIEAGDETQAIIELRHAERKTEMARLAMIEARCVEMGTV